MTGRWHEVGRALVGLVPQQLAGAALIASCCGPAAEYARCLLKTATGQPVSLTASSLHILYKFRADNAEYLAIAVSQSGAPPDIASSADRLRATGAVLDLDTGAERTARATKTVRAALAPLTLTADAPGLPRLLHLASIANLAAPAGLILEGTPDSPAHPTAAASGAPRLAAEARSYHCPAAPVCALKPQETAGMAAGVRSAAGPRRASLAVAPPGRRSSVRGWPTPPVRPLAWKLGPPADGRPSSGSATAPACRRIPA
ncbi:MAG: hypothetical protein ACR2MP_00840 [Streptosporangiaceae bacterium]